MYINAIPIRAFLFVAVAISSSMSVSAQDSKEAAIIGTVIGIERPGQGWFMHTSHRDLLYVRVDKVLKGRIGSTYISIGYPYNDGDSRLPEELFNGKHKWRFEISLFEEWSTAAAPFLEEEERVCKPAPMSDIERTLLSAIPREAGETQNLVLYKCASWVEPAKGMKEESSSLSKRGTLKGYFLRYGNKSPRKIP